MERFTVDLTKPQALRLMALVLEQMEKSGYDGSEDEFIAYSEILEALVKASD